MASAAWTWEGGGRNGVQARRGVVTRSYGLPVPGFVSSGNSVAVKVLTVTELWRSGLLAGRAL